MAENSDQVLYHPRRYFLLFTLLLFLVLSMNAQPWKEHGPLRIDPAHPHYIEFADGTPFLWFGDTGWEMIHRLNREETDYYLTVRKNQGFNLVQTVILSEFMNQKATNIYGDSLFLKSNPVNPKQTLGADPKQANEYDYWDHVVYCIKKAEEKGMFIGLVPTWGEWVVPREGSPLFNTGIEAYNYGWFVANLLKGSPNIIWILGGDRHPDERAGAVDIWRAMAEGIADATNGIKLFDGNADYSTTFMTHHSYNSSSNWFHKDPWIDCHMWGSYHADVNNPRSFELALKDWFIQNPKPTINGEPCYEGHPINYAIPDNGIFTSTDVRTAAYWSMFSGAAGFTYGANSVWQFADSSKGNGLASPLKNWRESLNMPGVSQVILLKKLMESYPLKELQPDPAQVLSGQGECSSYACAIRGKTFAFFYVPTGNTLTIRLGVLSGDRLHAYWFNPRNGEKTSIAEFDNTGERSFPVPGMSKELNWLRTGRGCDWVLVLESVVR